MATATIDIDIEPLDLRDAAHPPQSTISSVFHKILIKGFPPLEIGIIVLVIAAFCLLFPSISAAVTSSQLNSAIATPTTVTEPVAAAPVEEDISGYLVASDASNVYAQALVFDLEREYYTNLVGGNNRIVDAVYTYAGNLNLDLVFAQMLKESRGDPRAERDNVDRKTGAVLSTDRGLFQLNSKSYPDLSEAQFFNIETNTLYGTAHLRGELEYWGGNTRKALQSYNGGRGKPSSQAILYASDVIAQAKIIKANREAYIRSNLNNYSLAQASFKETK